MPSEPTKRKFRQPSRRTASSPVAKKAKDALSVPAEKSRDATSTSYSKAQALTSEVDHKIQEAKNFAVSQAQRDHSMGNYRIIDSPFGNFLIPVKCFKIPIHDSTKVRLFCNSILNSAREKAQVYLVALTTHMPGSYN